MSISKVNYLGDLRTEAEHLRSGIRIISDAPLDNKGRGEAFSPTDLLATSLAQCMMTLMGIAANENDFDMRSCSADVHKTMAAAPRRVSVINVNLLIKGSYTETQKEILKRAAINCPVAKSIHPDIHQDVSFQFVEE